MEEAPKVKRRVVGKQDGRTPEQKRLAAIKEEDEKKQAAIKEEEEKRQAAIKKELERKRAVIEKVYYDDATGCRNLRETWKAVRDVDNNITEKNVRSWKEALEAHKKRCPAYNSFIPSKPYEEFQIDLLFFTKEGEP